MRLRTANPALTAKAFLQSHGTLVAPAAGMRVDGVLVRSTLMLAALVAAGVVGWWRDPAWWALLGASIAAAVSGGLIGSRPERVAWLAWPYVLLQGYVYGAVSRQFEARAPGLVRDALLVTLGVMVTMLLIYRLRLIRLDRNFRAMVACAIGGLATVYLVTFVASLFGVQLPWMHEGSGWAIALSIYAVTAAAFNLVCDFDTIENAVDAGTPRAMEWYAAFGLTVSLVWLYVEVLRLLFFWRKRR